MTENPSIVVEGVLREAFDQEDCQSQMCGNRKKLREASYATSRKAHV